MLKDSLSLRIRVRAECAAVPIRICGWLNNECTDVWLPFVKLHLIRNILTTAPHVEGCRCRNLLIVLSISHVLRPAETMDCGVLAQIDAFSAVLTRAIVVALHLGHLAPHAGDGGSCAFSYSAGFLDFLGGNWFVCGLHSLEHSKTKALYTHRSDNIGLSSDPVRYSYYITLESTTEQNSHLVILCETVRLSHLIRYSDTIGKRSGFFRLQNLGTFPLSPKRAISPLRPRRAHAIPKPRAKGP